MARRRQAPSLDVGDVLEIHRLIALYGHIIDGREWSRVHELFTEDAVFDVTGVWGSGVIRGLAAIIDHWRTTDRHPIAHHATNVLVDVDPDGTVRVLSKGIGIRPDGASTIIYQDVVVQTPAGWRIRERVARRPGSTEKQQA